MTEFVTTLDGSCWICTCGRAEKYLSSATAEFAASNHRSTHRADRAIEAERVAKLAKEAEEAARANDCPSCDGFGYDDGPDESVDCSACGGSGVRL